MADGVMDEIDFIQPKKKVGELISIEVLEEDVISRLAVNTLVDELARAISDERCFMSRGRSTATILQDILDLPSVAPQPKTGWIPVSKGLPEDNKTYLVTVELTFARGERYVSQERKDDWDKLKECGHEIIAWMPLPEPYKLESEE